MDTTEGPGTETGPLGLDLPEPPGELVDVDGHLMHLYCIGEGSPTVLLEAGLYLSSLIFRELQEELATTERVCAYDRAGLGWSEPGPDPRTGQQMTVELKSLLEAAGEPGPYVLAGHSMGGLIVLLFAEANPDDVAGVVLIDASHPGQDEALAEFRAIYDAAQEEELGQLRSRAEQAEAGTIGPADTFASSPVGLSLDLREQWTALYLQPHSLRTIIAEIEAFPQTLSQAGGAGSLGDTPLIVLAAGLGLEEDMPAYDRQRFGITAEDVARIDSIKRSLQLDHVNRSNNARLVVAENSGHVIFLDEPEVVLEAIQELLRVE